MTINRKYFNIFQWTLNYWTEKLFCKKIINYTKKHLVGQNCSWLWQCSQVSSLASCMFYEEKLDYYIRNKTIYWWSLCKVCLFIVQRCQNNTYIKRNKYRTTNCIIKKLLTTIGMLTSYCYKNINWNVVHTMCSLN